LPKKSDKKQTHKEKLNFWEKHTSSTNYVNWVGVATGEKA